MKNRILILSIIYCLLLVACSGGESNNKYSNLRARLSIDNVLQASVLHAACESMGEFCAITSDGQSLIFTNAAGKTSKIPLTAMSDYSGYNPPGRYPKSEKDYYRKEALENTMAYRFWECGYTHQFKDRKIDIVVANNSEIDPEVTEKYITTENKRIVPIDAERIEKMGTRIIQNDIFCIDDGKIRHNAMKTAFLIFSFLMEGE